MDKFIHREFHSPHEQCHQQLRKEKCGEEDDDGVSLAEKRTAPASAPILANLASVTDSLADNSSSGSVL
uniref:Uncharacterized protein n=1 Tax=Romanomermis culicivorax TaxID=13658 RepID=A0A915I095_ROMCU